MKGPEVIPAPSVCFFTVDVPKLPGGYLPGTLRREASKGPDSGDDAKVSKLTSTRSCTVKLNGCSTDPHAFRRTARCHHDRLTGSSSGVWSRWHSRLGSSLPGCSNCRAGVQLRPRAGR